jgi:hypothetical protein
LFKLPIPANLEQVPNTAFQHIPDTEMSAVVSFPIKVYDASRIDVVMWSE